APCCKAWKGHLIKPATAINKTQHPRENDASDKSEGAKHEGKGRVGTTTGYQQKPQHHDRASAAPSCCPDQSHPNGATDASQQLLHAYPPCHSGSCLVACIPSTYHSFEGKL